ncbi:hypothetical protein BU26DRAFT_518176 [Trematosphaeria pertusa]|uniref:Peroxin 11C n=1 Tax=Trematosphaeria pertusa TaxID=390896 RepID=A0A6A6INY2_9PLEO|nr:uncharacterized protein BU26DRAFT_518176 [Trematosphaeria pertusa]KAF2251542.1 hypothetical protein BU26DRAFT_518176 [Trematosphaeria pertusa]
MASEAEPPISTTIPSDPTPSAPTPSSEPSKLPRTPANRPLLRRLRVYLLRYLTHLARRTDYNLLRLSKLLSSPTSTDALLCTISYTLELVHAVLERLLERRLTDIATTIAEKAEYVLLPGETLIATLPALTSTKILAQTVGSSRALAAIIGDFRIFVRLWGLVGIYAWARETWHSPLGKEAGRKEKLVRKVVWGQIVSCALFQVLENGAYLANKGVLTTASWSGEMGKARETKWWIWSSRFWAAHVVLELARLSILHCYRNASSGAKDEKEKEVLGDGEKEEKLLREENKKDDWLWWRDLVSNIAYMPMTLHWSVDEDRTFLPDWSVGLLGAVAGGSLLADAWRATA